MILSVPVLPGPTMNIVQTSNMILLLYLTYFIKTGNEMMNCRFVNIYRMAVSRDISCWVRAPMCFAGVGHHSCCQRGGQSRGQSPGTFEKRLMKFIPEPRPLLLQRGTRSRALRASSSSSSSYWPPRSRTFSTVRRRLGSYVLGIFPEMRISDSILL